MPILKLRQSKARRYVQILTTRKVKADHGLVPRRIYLESDPPPGFGPWNPEKLYVYSEKLDEIVELKPEQYEVTGLKKNEEWLS